MVVCPTCLNSYVSPSISCPRCGFAPEIREGFPCWAPESAVSGNGFDPLAFSPLAKNEEGHFWFEARNRLIVWALRTYFPDMSTFLEVGCGTGFVLCGVADAFSTVSIHGSELFVEGLEFAAERLPEASLMQMDVCRMPFYEHYDVVAAFDVLEHIEKDDLALRGICDAVKPGGGVILTVPQHGWLWSEIDEFACHKRRYSKDELHTLVERVGLRVVRSTSFVSLLLPAMMASRLLGGQKGEGDADGSKEFSLSPMVNEIFRGVLEVEALLIRAGVNIPIGGSRLVVAQKPEHKGNE